MANKSSVCSNSWNGTSISVGRVSTTVEVDNTIVLVSVKFFVGIVIGAQTFWSTAVDCFTGWVVDFWSWVEIVVTWVENSVSWETIVRSGIR